MGLSLIATSGLTGPVACGLVPSDRHPSPAEGSS